MLALLKRRGIQDSRVVLSGGWGDYSEFTDHFRSYVHFRDRKNHEIIHNGTRRPAILVSERNQLRVLLLCIELGIEVMLEQKAPKRELCVGLLGGRYSESELEPIFDRPARRLSWRDVPERIKSGGYITLTSEDLRDRSDIETGIGTELYDKIHNSSVVFECWCPSEASINTFLGKISTNDRIVCEVGLGVYCRSHGAIGSTLLSQLSQLSHHNKAGFEQFLKCSDTPVLNEPHPGLKESIVWSDSEGYELPTAVELVIDDDTSDSLRALGLPESMMPSTKKEREELLTKAAIVPPKADALDRNFALLVQRVAQTKPRALVDGAAWERNYDEFGEGGLDMLTRTKGINKLIQSLVNRLGKVNGLSLTYVAPNATTLLGSAMGSGLGIMTVEQLEKLSVVSDAVCMLPKPDSYNKMSANTKKATLILAILDGVSVTPEHERRTIERFDWETERSDLDEWQTHLVRYLLSYASAESMYRNADDRLAYVAGHTIGDYGRYLLAKLINGSLNADGIADRYFSISGDASQAISRVFPRTHGRIMFHGGVYYESMNTCLFNVQDIKTELISYDNAAQSIGTPTDSTHQQYVNRIIGNMMVGRRKLQYNLIMSGVRNEPLLDVSSFIDPTRHAQLGQLVRYREHLRRTLLGMRIFKNGITAMRGMLPGITKEGSHADVLDSILNWPPTQSRNVKRMTFVGRIVTYIKRHITQPEEVWWGGLMASSGYRRDCPILIGTYFDLHMNRLAEFVSASEERWSNFGNALNHRRLSEEREQFLMLERMNVLALTDFLNNFGSGLSVVAISEDEGDDLLSQLIHGTADVGNMGLL